MDESFLPPEAALDLTQATLTQATLTQATLTQAALTQAALTQAILARTSGSPCQRLHSLACAYVDDELAEGQRGLVQSHLAHCPACAALVAALVECQVLLPKLAQVEPGPWFAQRVLRATTHRPPPPGFDLGRAWRQLMHRPRIALEAAYLGAAASMMGIYLPIPVPQFAPHLTVRVPALVQPLSASAHRVMDHMAQVERRTTASLQQQLTPLEALRQTPAMTRQLWLRITTPIKTTLQGFRKASPGPSNPPSPLNPSNPPGPPKDEEKKPLPANP